MIIELLFLFLFSYIISYKILVIYYLSVQILDEIKYIKNSKIYFYYNLPRLFINIISFSTSVFLKKNNMLKKCLRKEWKLQNKLNGYKYEIQKKCRKKKRTTDERMKNISAIISKKYKKK